MSGVRRRLGCLRSSAEAGFTLVEMSVAVLLSALVAASLAGVLYSLGQNAGDAGRNSELQSAARMVMADLVLDLRQAEAVSENGYPVESLTADQIIFYSDRDETEGPERIVYERVACAEGLCELRVSRYAAVAGSGPEWAFQSAAFQDQLVMERVLNDQPLFRGASWTGAPATKTYVTTCAGNCSFSLVAIRLRATPERTSAGASEPFEITGEVEFRNAG